MGNLSDRTAGAGRETGKGSVRRWLEHVTGPWTRRNLMAWVYLLIFVILLRWLWFDAYAIPSDSMLPTLNGDPGFFKGDRVFVNKYRYGPRVPFMNIRIFDYQDPQRWDIVVFKAPHADAEHKTLIKRIVGLPGERVQIKGGRIHINGEAVEPPGDLAEVLRYTPYPTIDDDEALQFILVAAADPSLLPAITPDHVNGTIFLREVRALDEHIKELDTVTLDQARPWLDEIDPIAIQVAREFVLLVQQSDTPFRYGLIDEDQYSLIPEDHYFMLGDNSGYSIDGRYFGWVPRDNLVGPAFCVWWPWAHRQDFTGFTRTWQGMLILYGIPIGLILYLLITHSVGRIVRLPESIAPYKLQRGDCLTVNCAVFGLRWPFLHARMNRGRAPVRGEMVLYKDGEGIPSLGYVAANPGELAGLAAHEIAVEAGSGETPVIHRNALVGSVTSVCWPPGRRRKLMSPPTE